ncbi:hypothetical protein NO989_18245 [Alteromonas sp. DY56-G5]|jgi:hypothetical protein|uniref:Uncharacterized protein n=2 Tax=Alteromonas TaxID=226 RepID=A0AAC8XNN0_9ALTE|nr:MULTISPECIES: hypothetical protein [Alteromonas]PTT96278.1 hypothetical protein DBR45_44610 [Pseudomonas sp. HMWF031]AFV87593.1 hypothetical protein amad1_20768 [Alteromonas mediterranea DE1]AGP87630.1 hypothetical protein I607_19467 [Alteromonas mediterranea U4]AGP99612.1 hypothetical protein I635_20759 [Alteromonas mediterranea UM7]AMJ80720.1 hypothetical protein AV942_20260 [Alteromonas mediterranea]|tara:strand:- start:1939 stop:2160 length:222 start_codon:yes stop_codon:yes gene_type:complete
MSKQLNQVNQSVNQLKEARKLIPPAAARAVIDSVRSSEPNDDLLTLVGIIAGQNIQAEELLIAIRNEIQSTNR